MTIPRLTFDQAFSRLVHAEAGLSTDPNDPGNWTGGRVGVGKLLGTKYGIAANTYPDEDIPNLTLDRAKFLYQRDWWDKIGAEEIDSAIVYQLWDFAVNAGMETSKRRMQRVIGVAEDGSFGPLTIAAINAADLNDTLFLFTAEKIEYYTSLAKWPNYGKGWMNRTAQNLRYCASDNINLPVIVGTTPKDETSWQQSSLPSATSVPSAPLAQSSGPLPSVLPPFSDTESSNKNKEVKPQPLPQTLPPPNVKPQGWLAGLLRLLQKNPQP